MNVRPKALLLSILTVIIFSSVSSAEVLKIVVNDTIQPITEEYIDRLMGCLADGPDLLAMWEKEHRAEKDLSDKVAPGSKQVVARGSKTRAHRSKGRAALSI